MQTTSGDEGGAGKNASWGEGKKAWLVLSASQHPPQPLPEGAKVFQGKPLTPTASGFPLQLLEEPPLPAHGLCAGLLSARDLLQAAETLTAQFRSTGQAAQHPH